MSRELVTDELWALIESLLTLQMTVRMFRDRTAKPNGNRSLLVASHSHSFTPHPHGS